MEIKELKEIIDLSIQKLKEKLEKRDFENETEEEAIKDAIETLEKYNNISELKSIIAELKEIKEALNYLEKALNYLEEANIILNDYSIENLMFDLEQKVNDLMNENFLDKINEALEIIVTNGDGDYLAITENVELLYVSYTAPEQISTITTITKENIEKNLNHIISCFISA
jgi:DNA repair exonuclease SbcCD ATPase subunit